MTRRQKNPLRSLSAEEHTWLVKLSRAQHEPAAQVARAKELLAVADGHTYTEAAGVAGRKSGDAVSHLVARFNQQGLVALLTAHGGGPAPTYTAVERERILREARRPPDRKQDGTATWSLTTLRRALRNAPDGLPTVSTHTIWMVLHEAGWRWQRTQTWCDTGVVQRQRTSGTVTVTDPDTTPKKS